MSIEAMVWVFHNSEARSTTRLVALALANCASTDNDEAWPSVRTLAELAAVSTNTVVSALRELVDLGELEVLVAGTPRSSTHYQFTARPYESQRRVSATLRRDPASRIRDPASRSEGVSVAPVATDTKRNQMNKTHARDGHETFAERSARLESERRFARAAADAAAAADPSAMSDDEVVASFAVVPDRLGTTATTEGGARARGLRAELKDRLAESAKGARR